MWTLQSPWSLIALAGVLAVAVWLAFRPGRRRLTVASVQLWREALAQLPSRSRLRSRRTDLAWWLVLAGTLAGVFAHAQPVWRRERPARHVVLEVPLSAEFAADPEALRRPGERFLRRLGPEDRVTLVWPAELGPPSQPMAPSQAIERLRDQPMLPTALEEATFPTTDPPATHRLVLPGAISQGTAVPIATDVPRTPARLEALSIVPAQEGEWRALLAVRAGEASWRGQVQLRARRGDGTWVDLPARPVTVAPGRREVVLVNLPVGVAFHARLIDDGSGQVLDEDFRLRRPSPATRICLQGTADTHLQRFVDASEGVTPVAKASEADVVLAVGVDPPSDVPAIVFDPPTSPAGWGRGEPVGPVHLDQMNVATDTPMLADVDFAGVAVRTVRPFVPAVGPTPAAGRVLVARDGKALLIELTGPPRRLLIAMSPSSEQTNWGLSPSLPILLANAVEQLTGQAGSGWTVSAEPSGVSLPAGWKRRVGQVPAGGKTDMLWPGLYIDQAGQLHAVGQPDRTWPAEATAQPTHLSAGEVALPARETDLRPVEFWPALASLAGLLWLAGWATRIGLGPAGR